MLLLLSTVALCAPRSPVPTVDFAADRAPRLYEAAPPPPRSFRPPARAPRRLTWALLPPPIVDANAPLEAVALPVLRSLVDGVSMEGRTGLDPYGVFPRVGPDLVPPPR